MLEHGERIAPIRAYQRRITLEGLRLRGLAVKEYALADQAAFCNGSSSTRKSPETLPR